MKNVAASTRQRLLNLAKARGVAFNRVLVQYGIERVLYRLAQSKHSDKFVLKGAMLFVVWQGVQHRETRDLDLLGFGDNSIETLTRAFEEICAKAVIDDGLTFEGVTAQPITALQEYGGVSVKINARLEAARIVINVDVGFGDEVTPRPTLVDFPVLLDFPAPRIRAYPVETVVAEKFHALVVLAERNTRMKDFFDLFYLSASFDFDGGRLLRAIERTFERRNTPLPASLPVALSEAFALGNEGMWSAFLRRAQQEKEIRFVTVIETLNSFLAPVFQSATLRDSHWSKGGPWRSRRMPSKE